MLCTIRYFPGRTRGSWVLAKSPPRALVLMSIWVHNLLRRGMARPNLFKPLVACADREARLDAVHSCTQSLNLTIGKFVTAIKIHDLVWAESVKAESQVIQSHLIQLRREYWEHRREHGC